MLLASWTGLTTARFNHAEWADLKRENILIWLSFACFNMTYEETKANDNWCGFLEESVEMLEARTGTRFEDGYNPKLEIMRLTLDPVNVSLLISWRASADRI
jgi:hypothetical protein